MNRIRGAIEVEDFRLAPSRLPREDITTLRALHKEAAARAPGVPGDSIELLVRTFFWSPQPRDRAAGRLGSPIPRVEVELTIYGDDHRLRSCMGVAVIARWRRLRAIHPESGPGIRDLSSCVSTELYPDNIGESRFVQLASHAVRGAMGYINNRSKRYEIFGAEHLRVADSSRK